MKKYLITKLLFINLIAIGFVMIIVWISVDTLAAGYFVTLMKKYNISPGPAHDMFVSAVHRYLLWACLAAFILAVVLNFVMMRRVLAPLTRMIGITQDIASGKFDVRIPKYSEDEVGQLAAAFNRMAESLEEIETLRQTLMIDVAHELRTPLTNIRGYLEALTDGIVPPATETFSLLQDETLRLVQLVEDVLQLARADAAKDNLELKPIDLHQIVDHTLKDFAGMLSHKSITINFHAPEYPIKVPADPDRIYRVVRNLTDNSVRYTPVNGNVEINLETDNEHVKMTTINDAGELVPEDLPYLFERFYRGEKSRSRYLGGAGIGLAIVKELVKAHGGNVGAELKDSQVRIWFQLPMDHASEKNNEDKNNE